MTKQAPTKPIRIAVLGGGISSLTAVFDLTSEPGWEAKYDITIYQMGWRLGGKGASSRNPSKGNRIEEHGLHIWLGFYENAFQIMRQCYAELPETAATFRSWQEAFKPQSFVVLEEKVKGDWLHWSVTLPTNSSLPGEGHELLSLWEYFCMALNAFEELLLQRPLSQASANRHIDLSSWSSAIMRKEKGTGAIGADASAIHLVRATHRHARKMAGSGRARTRHRELTAPLDDLSRWLDGIEASEVETDAPARRRFILLDLLCAVARGVVADGALVRGLDVLDGFEFREWLERHGASPISVSSAWLRGLYDLAFSFEDGDSSKANIAAGVAVRALFRIVFTYKGAALWKMQAGMGETVFTPLYLALRNRGVKFEFFHKVERLELGEGNGRISQIEMTRQATLKSGAYDPLIRVKRWDCWRPQPDFTQLVEGAKLEKSGANLESNWSTWAEGTRRILKNGEDFDQVVLGIPIAALKTICAPLAEVRADWRTMLAEVKTNQTQGFQLWLDRNLAECGWTDESPVLGAYVEPIDTWADMSHLLAAEAWPQGNAPVHLAYFCGVMPDADHIPDPSDPDFPTAQNERTFATALEFCTLYTGYLWPAAVAGTAGALDWSCLHADGVGTGRLREQYWRANIDPSERYTLAVAGSTKYRLRADQSGFANLVLAGDWLRNGLNTPGCIELAVISGRQAARVISHSNRAIIGETDFPPELSPIERIVDWLASCWVWIAHLLRHR